MSQGLGALRKAEEQTGFPFCNGWDTRKGY